MILTSLCRSSAGAAALLAMFAMPTAPAVGASPANCDKTIADVRADIEKDPSKVLMYVEDALVINETCACEIVKTAIEASKADADLIKQIVQTSIAVAPRMTAVINECSGGAVAAPAVASTTTKSGKDVVDVTGGKDAMNVVPGKEVLDVQPPKDGGTRSFGNGTADIRGFYLIQPATGVFGGGNVVEKEEEEEKTRTKVITRTRVVYVKPTSPVCPDPKKDDPKDEDPVLDDPKEEVPQ